MKDQPIWLIAAAGVMAVLASVLTFTTCNRGSKINTLEQELSLKSNQVAQLEQQVDHLQGTNSSLLNTMSDLSVVSKSGAESIQKSLENMGKQYDFIQDLTKKIQSKDSLNLALVMNIKRSLADINDQDLQVEVRGGMVHVSISDKLLFRSGSSNLGTQAQPVLSKLASVLNDHSDFRVMVEGHTDDVPISTDCVSDNWDLSVRRATTVVRALQEDYLVSPDRLTAAGRASYDPKGDNSTSQGRSLNRRTEIGLMPLLDQFFKLLEAPPVAN